MPSSEREVPVSGLIIVGTLVGLILLAAVVYAVIG